jgi:hypothetical protein
MRPRPSALHVLAYRPDNGLSPCMKARGKAPVTA